MFRKYKNDKNTFGIIGLGRFGMALALELASTGEEIIAIDRNEEKIRQIREYTENAFIVHNLDKNTLLDAGIHNCDIVIVCIGEKLDTSILTTLNLTSIGVKKVIAKANSPEHGEILKKLGAEVVFPEQDMALRLASSLKTSAAIDFVRLSEKINVTKLHLPDCLSGQSVIDANLRRRFNLNIIAIESKGELIDSVKPEYILKKGDLLYLAGSQNGFNHLAEWIESGN